MWVVFATAGRRCWWASAEPAVGVSSKYTQGCSLKNVGSHSQAFPLLLAHSIFGEHTTGVVDPKVLGLNCFPGGIIIIHVPNHLSILMPKVKPATASRMRCIGSTYTEPLLENFQKGSLWSSTRPLKWRIRKGRLWGPKEEDRRWASYLSHTWGPGIDSSVCRSSLVHRDGRWLQGQADAAITFWLCPFLSVQPTQGPLSLQSWFPQMKNAWHFIFLIKDGYYYYYYLMNITNSDWVVAAAMSHCLWTPKVQAT